MTPTPARRVVVVLLLIAALLGAVAADRLVKEDESEVRVLPGTQGPEAHPASSLSSSWYCPGGPSDGGPLSTRIGILNPGGERVDVTVTAMPQQGDPGSKALFVGPASSLVVNLGEVVPSTWTAALVEVHGAGVVVEQSVGSPSDFDTAPCAPAASTSWYFPSGSTARDATMVMLLFNPFPDDAIIDMAFATPEGRRVPGNFEGVVVKGGTVHPVDIGAHVRRQDVVSTEVKARSGRVVASQLLQRSAPGAAGLSLTLGAPRLSEEWVFPDGLANDGVVERYEFFNPNLQEARVDIELALAEGEVEPFEITIPALGRFTLDPREGDRVPKGVAHAAIVTSVNEVPVAVARVLELSGARRGRSDTLAAWRASTRWGFPMGSATEASDEWVIVFNADDEPARVSFTAMADGQPVAVSGLQDIEVPAGRRVPFRLTDHIKRAALPLVVQSTRPVYVERALFGSVATSMGIPLD